MAIQRGNKSNGNSVFTVGLNITLNGSKMMSEAEQEAALVAVAGEEAEVTVTIESAKGILVKTTLPAKQFSTGSVGWGLQEKASFKSE